MFAAPNLAGALVFMTGIAYWPGIIGAATTPRWAVVALGLAGLAWRLRLPPAPWLLATGLGYAAFSLAWSPDPFGGAGDLVHLALFGLALVAGVALADLRPVFVGAALATIVMLPSAVIEAGNGEAATGLFLNRDSLAQFAALASVGLVAGWWRFLLWGPLLCLALSRSIGGVAALLIGWLALVWPDISDVIRALTILLLAAAVGWVVIDPFLWADTAIGAPIWANSIAPRLAIWRDALAGLSWFGAGLGGYAALFPVHEFAHNDALQLAYELGLGALPLVLLAGLAWRGGLPVERAVFAAFIAETMIGFPLNSPATALLGGLVAGRLVGARLRLRGAQHRSRNRDRPALRWRGAVGPRGCLHG